MKKELRDKFITSVSELCLNLLLGIHTLKMPFKNFQHKPELKSFFFLKTCETLKSLVY